MGIARGPNIITEGLVFGYDTGYGIANNNTATRFYPGQPSVNLFGDISNANARPNRTEYNTSAWTANFPKPPEDVGRVYSHTSGSLNSTWSGNSYGYTLISYSYLANTTYTLSCWVYVSIDANLSSMATSMESTTLTHTANRNYDLNNKGTWQQISLKCNSSSAVSGNAIIAYPSRNGVTDGSHTGFWAIGGAKLEINDQVTPYVLGTRSSTASLIDLKRTTDIDVSDVSFDSTGQPDFDGSSDRGIVENFPHIWDSSVSMECVVKWDDTSRSIIFGNYTVGANDVNFEQHDNKLRFYWNRGERNEYSSTSALTRDGSRYHHCVFVRDIVSNNFRFYIDGVLDATSSNNAGSNLSEASMPTNHNKFRIGADTRTGATVHNGAIPVIKVYSKALSTAEVTQNYKAYKNRFNI